MEYTYTKNYFIYLKFKFNQCPVLFFAILATLLSDHLLCHSASASGISTLISLGIIVPPILIATCDVCLTDAHFLPLPPLEHMTQA